jgi:hypothetical protein
MIRNFVNLSLSDPSKGTAKANFSRKSLILRYPCTNRTSCTPYKLNLKPGAYQVECWGARGEADPRGYPGMGAYTRGSFSLFSATDLYVFVGATGHFNSYKNFTYVYMGVSGGGATDIRLENSVNWFDIGSLKSRIMVAAGGGGSEWACAIGGNGGGLVGGTSYSAINCVMLETGCLGSKQTSGSECVKYGNYGIPTPGTFGVAGYFVSAVNDYGGIGGGGYYGGTSYDYSYSGSGGSSFISGHDGCKAIKKASGSIEHKDDSFHYSGYVFYNTTMIDGNTTMPLPTGGEGIWGEKNGAFRITLISFDLRTINCQQQYLSYMFFVVILFSN